MDTYYDSAEDLTITRKRAQQEIRRHGFATPAQFGDAWADLIAELGDHPTYNAQAVLTFLGY